MPCPASTPSHCERAEALQAFSAWLVLRNGCAETAFSSLASAVQAYVSIRQRTVGTLAPVERDVLAALFAHGLIQASRQPQVTSSLEEDFERLLAKCGVRRSPTDGRDEFCGADSDDVPSLLHEHVLALAGDGDRRESCDPTISARLVIALSYFFMLPTTRVVDARLGLQLKFIPTVRAFELRVRDAFGGIQRHFCYDPHVSRVLFPLMAAMPQCMRPRVANPWHS